MNQLIPLNCIVMRYFYCLVLLVFSSVGLAQKPLMLDEIRSRLSEGRETRIVCFGDSITGAYYHSGGVRAWCEMLGLALTQANPRSDVKMFNAGISGHTTVNAMERIAKDVIARRPHLVVVMFGMNDVARVPLKQYRKNLNEIVQRCRDVGALVVLCTPNAVYETESRPENELAMYAQSVREIASEQSAPLVDLFADGKVFRREHPIEWALTMSDEIHPNLTGHNRFAKLIGETICGRPVNVRTTPPLETIHHTLDRLADGKPVHLVAMPPYDKWMPKILKEHFQDATIKVTTWPVTEQSTSELAQWAREIRGRKPDLVMPAVPANAMGKDLTQFIRDYEWILNWSFPFSGQAWDVVPVLPTGKSENESERRRIELARQIVSGKDRRFIQPPKGDVDSCTVLEDWVLEDWVMEQKRVWMGARSVLPTHDDFVFIPGQEWPYRPDPRFVKVSVHYPDGQITSVNEKTGIMLTLHNWGGEDCVGTANPKVLAERLNVIAVCVNYLQSGKVDSVASPAPYDFGLLQAVDALRGLALVRNGLKQAGLTYDDGRLFCAGGSGGGNVTLMANKLAPRTFACVIDMSGMKKLTNDIAFNEPGGSSLNARWSPDPADRNYLTSDAQAIRFLGNPGHLRIMKTLGTEAKVITVHGQTDSTCPFEHAKEFASNASAAGLKIESHFIGADDVDGAVFTNTGHGLGDRTEIVFRVAGKFLDPNSNTAIRRHGPTDFEIADQVTYPTPNGKYVINYQNGIATLQFRR